MIIDKIFTFVKSLFFMIYAKLTPGFTVKGLSWIRGTFHVQLLKRTKCVIGRSFVTMGPFYLKCLEGSSLTIGENCFFNHNCSITSAVNIVIGNGCNFANNVVIVDHDHIFDASGVKKELSSAPISIGDNVWIGANVTILKGVCIGEGAVVAANSVVRSNVDAHTIVAGVPAKAVKRIIC